MKNLRKNNDFATPSRLQIVPRWPRVRPRWPKIIPRPLQDLPKTILKRYFWCVLLRPQFVVRFDSNLGSVSSPLWASKTTPKSDQRTSENRVAAIRPPGSLQDGRGPPTGRPKTPPDPPRSPPGRPQSRQERPRCTQNRTRGGPRAPKSIPKGPLKSTQTLSETDQKTT